MPEEHLPADRQTAASFLGAHGESEAFYHSLLRHAVVVHDCNLTTVAFLYEVGVDITLIWAQRMHVGEDPDPVFEPTVDLHVAGFLRVSVHFQSVKRQT